MTTEELEEPSGSDPRVLRFESSEWMISERERRLFAEARKLPSWRLANQARRVLASFTHQLSASYPAPAISDVADLDANTAQQLAVIPLATLAVRQTGAVLVLIGTGYEAEALAHARSLLEAQYRARQASDDRSGEAARAILRGQPRRSLKQLANRYGDQREIELLDHFAHADIRQLLTLAPGLSPQAKATAEVHVEVLPKRGVLRPALQLYAAGQTAASISGVLAEVFGVAVEIPRWLSGQLIHYRDNPLPDPL